MSQSRRLHPDLELACGYFATPFFSLLFALCIGAGWLLNNRSFKGYGQLLKDTGYSSDFSQKYGMPACLINTGICGICFLIYLNLITRLTEGAGFTGPTMGVLLASLTFTAMGQHPKKRMAHRPGLSGSLLPHGHHLRHPRPGFKLVHFHPKLHQRRGLRYRPQPPYAAALGCGRESWPVSSVPPCVPPPAPYTAVWCSTTAALPPESPP